MSETAEIKALFEHVEKVIKDQIAPVQEAIRSMSAALSTMTDKVSNQQSKMAVLEERIKNEKEDRITAYANIEGKLESYDEHRVKSNNQLTSNFKEFQTEIKATFKERDTAHEKQQNKKLVIIGLVFTAISTFPEIAAFFNK